MSYLAQGRNGPGVTRRRVVLGMSGGVGAAALAGCGPTAPSGNEAVPSRAPQEVTWSIYGDQTTRPFFDAITDRFNQQNAGKHVAVLNLVAGSEYIDKTLAALAADAPSDVFLTYAQYKPAWVKKNLLLDVSSRFRTSKVVNTKMYYQPVVDAISYQGKQWGTPWGYNATMMFIVVDRFTERNIALPSPNWTMPDYAALAKRLTDPEKKIFGTTNAANVAGQSMFSLMWNYGKHYWVDANETKSLVNSEGAIEMFRAFQDMQFRDMTVPWSGNPPKPEFGFNQGAIAMSIQYTSVASYNLVNTFEKQNTSFAWKMHTFPKGPKDQQHFSQGHIWSIAKTHKQPDRAWVMAEWLGSMEAEKVWAETGRTPPQVPNQELWSTFFGRWPAETRKESIDFILNTLYKGKAVNFQYWSTFYDCEPIMKAALADVYGPKQVPPKTAMDDAARKIDEVLRR
ncbi:MAG: extracellular solute-binding protein [Chloroflexi bacterium]|nr:extracellular solute-binding protein [Chloroflexota bacterium]